MTQDNRSTISVESPDIVEPQSGLEDEYIMKHQNNMYYVLDELLYISSIVYCSNDMCEKEIYKSDSVECEFMDQSYYFCMNDNCRSYGMWSIRYDYRKSFRQNRLYREKILENKEKPT